MVKRRWKEKIAVYYSISDFLKNFQPNPLYTSAFTEFFIKQVIFVDASPDHPFRQRRNWVEISYW
jgi:hypothetical protein